MKQHINKAIRYKIGWIWYNSFGRDYGPYDTKKQATVLGQERSKKEEALLRRPSGYC